MFFDVEEALDKIQEFKYTRLALNEICDIRAKGNPNPLAPEILVKEKAFYVFNDDYLKQMFGEDYCIRMGFYNKEGLCYFYKRLMLPIRDVVGNVIAFNAYTNDPGFPKYQLSSKLIWDRNKYFYANEWDYKEGLNRGYINLIDGTFDKLRFNSINEPAFGIFGSELSQEQIAILRCYKNIIIHPDNDEAGYSLWHKLKKIPNLQVTAIERTKGKDVDDFLSYSKKNETILLKSIKGIINSNFCVNLKI